MKLSAAIAICVITLSNSGLAQETKEASKADKTHEVKQGFFEVVENVTGIVESKLMTSVSPDTENWTDLVIEKIVPEGSRVKQSEPVIWFDTEKLDRKIKETDQSVSLAQLNLKATELEMGQLEQTFGLDKQMAERKHRNAEQDHKYFNEVQKPNQIRSTERNVKNSQWSLEYAQEEFNQLERMYQEDELTEESEEIVLKRTRRGVENSQFYLEQAQIRATHMLDTQLPRQSEQQDEQLMRAKLEYEKAMVTMPIERDKKKVEFDKANFELKKQTEDFNKLLNDRKQMVVNAPADGVVYYGRCVRGKWLSATGSGSRELSKGKSVPNKKTAVTIVDPNQLMLRADLTEKQLAMIKPNQKGLATPMAFRNAQTTARVSSISYVPVAADKYDCQMELTENPQGLMPGMTCQVRFVVQQLTDAISVPESAVFTDDGLQHYVFVKDGDETRRQKVEVGLTANKVTHIVEGLKAGQKILTSRPK